MADTHDTPSSPPTTTIPDLSLSGGSPTTADTPLPPSPSPALLSPPSESEARYYYFGLGETPLPLVARSSTTPWEEPTGPKEEWKAKEIGPAFYPKLAEAMEHGLRSELWTLLKSKNVAWNLINVSRIGFEEERPQPIVLLISVKPGSLSPTAGVEAVVLCKKLMVEHDIADVEVEIYESDPVYWGSLAIRQEQSKSGSKEEEELLSRLPPLTHTGAQVGRTAVEVSLPFSLVVPNLSPPRIKYK